MSKLFENNSDSEPETFKTDNEYAKNYDKWRKKEELNKLKTKYGDSGGESTSEDSSSEEDEEGVEITEKVEKEFFKTLACLKNKDPRIYDEKVKFFDDDEEEVEEKPKKTSKQRSGENEAVFLKDYERKLILEKGGVLSDEDEENEDKRPMSPTYVEEQKQMKESLKKALNSVDDDDQEDWGGIFKKRQKTKEETEKEEAEYKKWLAGQKDQLEDEKTASELKPLKDFWSKPDLGEDEKFLRDFILNKRYLDKEDDDYIPTYEEIVHDSDQDLSNDEETIEQQEEFEHKYNFRFEEPDQEFIKRYPRTVENSLRRTDDKRKLKRQELKERKKREKEEKMQDLKQLRELKRKEIEEKLEKLKEITGNETLGFADDDLEGDFDPEQHDKRMQELFSDDFYQAPEDDQKPTFPDLDEELEIENYERFDPTQTNEDENEPHCEDDNFNMDCDYDPSNPPVPVEGRKKRRKRKSKFIEALNKPKPKFDPEDKTYEEYFEEYYKLDCEDFIGDLPCRFKYRQVAPNDFGLSVEEILLAKERELNKWCSLKKAVQIRSEAQEKYDQIAYKKKAQNLALKKRILPSVFQEDEQSGDGGSGGKDKESVMKEEINESMDEKADNVAVGRTKDEKYGVKGKKSKKGVKVEKEEINEGTGQIGKSDVSFGKKKNSNVEERNDEINDGVKVEKEEFNEGVEEKIGKKRKEKSDVKGKIHKKGVKVKKGEIDEGTVRIDKADNVAVTIGKKKRKLSVGETNKGNDGVEERKEESNEGVEEKSGNVTGAKKKKLKLIVDGDEDEKKKQEVTKIVKNKKKNKKKTVNGLKEKEKRNNSVSLNLEKSKRHKRVVGIKSEKIKRNENDNVLSALTDERLKAYGIKPKRFRNKLKYKK